MKNNKKSYIKKVEALLRGNPSITNRMIYQKLGAASVFKSAVCDCRRQLGIRQTKTRDIILKVISEGKTAAEISIMLGLTEGAIYASIRRGKAREKKKLD